MKCRDRFNRPQSPCPAAGGTRTLTPLPEADFKSAASTNSATAAWERETTIPESKHNHSELAERN